MQTDPSMNSGSQQLQFEETDVKISEFFGKEVNLAEKSPIPPAAAGHEKDLEDQNQQESEDEEEEEEEDDFSFACYGADNSTISAEEAFHNGQIRPIFPLFNRDLLFADDGSEDLNSRLSLRPPVRKVFVETSDPPLPSSSSEGDELNEIISGPYCVWNKKAMEASPDLCKKSNSTGFSKLWRFRDFVSRSNSDGRDAFVFLSNSNTTATNAKREEKVVQKSEGPSENTAGDEKVKLNVTGRKIKVKKGVKSKTSSLSAHELYLRNKSKEDNRRRSYLPYRPELVGFFTNVYGGMSRNVHPF